MNDISRVYPDGADAHAKLVHEFKNQLAVMLGFCDLLLTELPEDDPRRADLQQMQQAGHAALALLPRLLNPLR